MNKDNSAIDVTFSPTAGQKVLLSFHGGDYISNSAHPKDIASNLVRSILKSANDSVRLAFSVEYRLSTTYPHTPSNPFPTALIDALAGYSYLVNEKGFLPQDIIVEGDSCGGNLALALTRYLVEYQHTTIPNFPAPPSALLLLSPW